VPELSIVVPTRDRAALLSELLDSLQAQTLDASRVEVIVVDDGSLDGPPRAVERELPAVRLLARVGGANRSAARNDGWRAARPPLVAFTDDDCVADPGWAAALLEAARRKPGALVQGATSPRPDQLHLLGPFSRTQEVREGDPWYQTCNVLYPRELLERLGGFDAEAYPGFGGEDTDLAWRAIESGAPTAFEPAARIFHAVRVLGPVGTLRHAASWTQAVRAFADHPGLRRAHATHGVFWKLSHYLLLRSLALLVLAARRPAFLVPAIWLSLPYVRLLRERARAQRGGPLLAPFLVLVDLVETAAVARGAARYRTLML
jgi:glycosyltransferase involved in cell wall biosynthesis